MNQVNMGGYVRISKATALAKFNSGNIIRIVPCKYIPNNNWITYDADPEYLAKNYEGSGETLTQMFNTVINSFRYYNCNYEVGYYPAFYISE